MKKPFIRGYADCRGQSVAEYFLVMVLVFGAIVGAGFINRSRNTLEAYRERTVNLIKESQR